MIFNLIKESLIYESTFTFFFSFFKHLSSALIANFQAKTNYPVPPTRKCCLFLIDLLCFPQEKLFKNNWKFSVISDIIHQHWVQINKTNGEKTSVMSTLLQNNQTIQQTWTLLKILIMGPKLTLIVHVCIWLIVFFKYVTFFYLCQMTSNGIWPKITDVKQLS